MAGIQTRVSDGRGGYDELTHHDARYWEGPYAHQDYPKALYRQVEPGRTDATEVKTAEAHAQLGPGWYESPVDAAAAVDRQEAVYPRRAAQRHFRDQPRSVRAQEEALARDRATDLVLPDLGAAPTKKRSHQKQTPVERP